MMRDQNSMPALFGRRAREVLASYGHLDRLQRTLRSLDDELDQLRRQRESLGQQNAEKIKHQRTRIADAETKRAELQRAVDELVEQEASAEAGIASVWRRTSIRLRRLFSSGVESVSQRLEQIEQLGRDRERAIHALEEIQQQLNHEHRALRRMTEPAASLEFAIDYLTSLRASELAAVARHDATIDEAIRAVARDATPDILQRKLAAITGHGARASLAADVLDLKQTLTMLDFIRFNPQANDEERDEFATYRNLVASVESGFQTYANHGAGDVEVNGRGTTHVRKTRTVTDTEHGPNSKTRRVSRTETYWDKVPIRFSGAVRATFDVEFNRWTPERLVQPVRNEADLCFRQGARHFQDSSTATGEVQTFNEQARSLTQRIRQRLESSR